jgi:hypothetical protein
MSVELLIESWEESGRAYRLRETTTVETLTVDTFGILIDVVGRTG